MSPPIPPHPHCPHEETIASLGNTLKNVALKLDENTDKTDRILDLLQGEDPLSQPGQGLVAEVQALRREREDRDTAIRKAKALAFTGATAAAGGLGLSLWEWFKAHWK